MGSERRRYRLPVGRAPVGLYEQNDHTGARTIHGSRLNCLLCSPLTCIHSTDFTVEERLLERCSLMNRAKYNIRTDMHALIVVRLLNWRASSQKQFGSKASKVGWQTLCPAYCTFCEHERTTSLMKTILVQQTFHAWLPGWIQAEFRRWTDIALVGPCRAVKAHTFEITVFTNLINR